MRKTLEEGEGWYEKWIKRKEVRKDTGGKGRPVVEGDVTGWYRDTMRKD